MKTAKETLIAKYLSGNASQEEIREVLDWVNENSANAEEFDLAKKLWHGSLSLKKESVYNVNEALNDLLERSKEQPLNKKSSFKLQPLQIAAAILLLISSLIVIKFFTKTDITEKTISLKEKIVTVEKESTIVNIITTDSAKAFFLPDSSYVFLNKHSKLSYPEEFNTLERATTLSGEAFFEIKHSHVPFIILCKQTKTRVVGTSFNIKGYDSDKKIIVSVVTGTVQLSDSKNDTLIIKANERATFDSEKTTFSKTNYTDKNFIWWKKVNLKARIKKIIKKIKNKIK